MAWQFPKMTRRTFLKSTSVSAVGATLYHPDWIRLAGPTHPDAADHFAHSICNYCSSFCSLRITVAEKKGKQRIMKLGGNPNSTLNGDKICARGQSGLRQVYSANRIKTPLIRVAGSKRGEMKFRSATWEEAWDYIAQKSKGIKPWEWTIYGGWSTCSFYIPNTFCFTAANQIPNLITSPTQNCVFNGHFGTNSMTGNYVVHGENIEDYENSDYILSIIGNASIGGVSTCRAVRFAAGIEKGAKVVVLDPRASETAAKADEWYAIKPGTDLDFTLAMLREMMNNGWYDEEFLVSHSNMPFLVRKNAHNAWELYLSAQKEPAVIDAHSGQVVFLPAFSNHNLQSSAGASVTPLLRAPQGFTHNGEAMLTVFDAQHQEIQSYTPEWAAANTGISAADIRKIVHDFHQAKSPILIPGWSGARYGNIQMLRRVQAMIQGLKGGFDVPGGWIFGGDYREQVRHMWEVKNDPKAPPMASLAGMPFVYWSAKAAADPNTYPHGYPAWAAVHRDQTPKDSPDWAAFPFTTEVGLDSAVKGKLTWKGTPYLCKAILFNGTNPLRDAPESFWEEVLNHPNMDLVVVMDVMPSDTLAYADVVLPELTYLERDEPAIYGNGTNPDNMLITRYQAVPPLYDNVILPDALLKLTEIISGSSEPYYRALEQLAGVPVARLKTLTAENRAKGIKNPFNMASRQVDFEMKAKGLGITPQKLDADLRKNGVYPVAKADELIANYGMPRKMALPTPSGRAEFYSNLYGQLREQFGLWDNPYFSVLATHIPADCRPGSKAPMADDEFYFTFGMVPVVSHCSPNNDFQPLVSISKFRGEIYTGLWVHSLRAGKLGLKEGDKVWVTNQLTQQKAEASVHVTRLVREDTVFLYSGYGDQNPALTHGYRMGTALNKITPDFIEPVSGGFRSQEFTVRLERA
ncbi:MAG: molybdopterin-dependent oxidoreductase [Acidithiobacillus sp.]